MVAACDSSTGPGDPDTEPDRDVGIAIDAPSASALVGEWARDELVEVNGATARRAIVWRFDDAGTCRRTIAFFPNQDLAPVVDESVCVYEAERFSLTLRFPGVTDDARLGWTLERRGQVLVLDGERYLRIGG